MNDIDNRQDTKNREAWLRIAYVGFPAGRLNSALERWKTPQALLDAAVQQRDAALLETSGITVKMVQRLRQAAKRDLQKSWEAIEKYQIRLLLFDDQDYPAPLRNIDDPPPYLFARGQWKPSDANAVAIVGTRRLTTYGADIAEKFAAELAAHGFTVVSGLARGIDTRAHTGALRSGRTIAVCGCGLDLIYPSENKELMARIIDNGVCLSEYPPGDPPIGWHFPARNRIISGLSRAVLIVESGVKSGSLITADFALEQGKEVFAVPGNIHRPQSRGTHMLIKQGAGLVESVEDIEAALNETALPLGFNDNEDDDKSTFEAVPRDDLTDEQNRLMLALDVEPKFIDDLAEAAQMHASQANAALVILEMKGIAKRLPGSTFIRNVN